MTVIAVCSDGSRCCMAADSQATRNGSVAIMDQPKIIRRGELLFGPVATMALGQALRYHLPEPEVKNSLNEWCARVLTPWLASYLRENELTEKIGARTEWPGGLLVAWRSNWLELDGNGSVLAIASDWWAIGSGGAEARGAMYHASQVEHAQADQIVRTGVEAACELDDGCRPPVVLEWTSTI